MERVRIVRGMKARQGKGETPKTYFYDFQDQVFTTTVGVSRAVAAHFQNDELMVDM